MLEEGLADLDFAREVAADFVEYAREVEQWTPERVEHTCGVNADITRRLAREFATARPSVIRCGIAPQQAARDSWSTGLASRNNPPPG